MQITVGMAVAAGATADDYDEGVVHEIAGRQARVGWESGVQTWTDMRDLHRLHYSSPISWREAAVEETEAPQQRIGLLGDLVRNSPAFLDDAVIEDGEIKEIPGHALRPRATALDWTGFADAIRAARGGGQNQ